MNKQYNWSAIPKKFKNKHTKSIPIGSKNPVEDFKTWCGNYWRDKEHRYDKSEPTY